MRELPHGTVTFLFTDIEGSTRLLEELGSEDYADELAEHRRVLREAFERHGGVEVDTQGDAFFVAFPTAPGALSAAREAQEALELPVRMGLHTGTPLLAEEGYVGADVHRAARIAAAGHGRQVLLSAATATLVGLDDLRDLGEHRLKDFDEPITIFQLGDDRFPPLKTISTTNLPRPASSFVGRERETADVVRVLRASRLVTLTGPGGSGKTRLALETAAEVVPGFRAGVFWVGLAPLADPALVSDTIAQTLGAKAELAEHIGDREMLLLLDNFEQVVDAAPELARLVEHCPNLRLLVTSRELLRVRGEVEYAVQPLAEADAVELFCARSSIEPGEEIAALCRRLDDLPLAVELAAARTSVLSPAQILERLSQRLDLFVGGRDVDERQQTLRATIEWSHDLLGEEEQCLFARLAVFAGGCTLEAAEAVCDARLDALRSLVDKSLVRHAGERFWMLETIREFARERLEESGEAPELRLRHARFLCDMLECSEPALHGEEQLAWLARLAAEHDNIRVALAHARGSDPLLMLRLASAASWFWLLRSHLKEGCTWLDAALEAAPDAPPTLRAPALEGRGRLTFYDSTTQEGDEEAQRLLAAAVELWREAGDVDQLAGSLAYAALTAGNAGDSAGAREAGEEAIAVSAAAGDWTRALALWAHGANLVLRLCGPSREDDPRPLLEEAVTLFRRCGDAWGLGAPLFYLARIALEEGDVAGARPLFAEALDCFRSVGDKWRQSYTARTLGELLEDDAPTEARALYEEAAELFDDLGNDESARKMRAQIAGLSP